MIELLNLKNVATYDATGIVIKDLKKINFIYGVNGSGKTTLTKLIDMPKEPLFKDCSAHWKNGLVYKALVYNKDFRDKNFGQGKMDGVFTLGQATKEQTEKIEAKIIERKKLKEEWNAKKETLEKFQQAKIDKENEFKEAVWVEIYKKHENEFKEAFTGNMVKENFKNKIIDEFQNNKSALLGYDVLKEKAKTIFGSVPLELPLIVTFTFDRLVEIEKDPIWVKKIVGKADVNIAKLIQRLNINDWVNQGRKFITDDPTCPFCQGDTITPDFRKQLEAYFDESFISDTAAVMALGEEYNRLAANLVNLLRQIETAEKANKNSKINKETFSAFSATFASQIVSNGELIAGKNKEPSRSVTLISIKAQLEGLLALVTDANKEITKHNLIVVNYSREKQSLIANIWRLLTENHKISIQNFITDRDNKQKGIAGVEEQIKTVTHKHNTLNVEIKELSKSMTSIQPSIDQINSTLNSYGFKNFSIVASNAELNKYQIQRADGTIAESTMSEGEITFITFLYFLQLTKGSTSETSISDDRILVIDDPICSLDSNVLFVVSSLVKEIIKKIKKGDGNIKQLILLTHNVYFHKEVSFIDGRTPRSADTYFWILRRNDHVSKIQAFEMENPIQSSYQLLWNELKNRQNSSGLTIQNTMRRIIENYFRLLGKYGDDQLIGTFPNDEEQQICRSLICWINDGSHTIPDDLYIEHQGDIVDRYFAVFEKIFEYTKHKEHYNMMMGEPAA